jgi:hypothetical protein
MVNHGLGISSEKEFMVFLQHFYTCIPGSKRVRYLRVSSYNLSFLSNGFKGKAHGNEKI